MAKPPDCANCSKPATIHLTQIIDNEIKKLDFCEDCPYQQGVADTEGFSLAELLAQTEQTLAKASSSPALKCSSCGFTPADFKRLRRLGCPQCYVDLAEFLRPMLQNVQGVSALQHAGKAPSQFAAQRERSELQQQLEAAIADERFEDAARIRDQLSNLSQSENAEDDQA